MPLALLALLAAGAIWLVSYLLWPTWRAAPAIGPSRLPISVGGVLFNVPADAIRMKVQRRSGPQDRIDLTFVYPSLAAPGPAPHVSADTIESAPPAPDRIFLSIAERGDGLSPDERNATVYPRYLQGDARVEEGLSIRAFSDASPYRGEDLVAATDPAFTARCTRDAMTPGICLTERRLAGADLTFRFPRVWLSDWRGVAQAIDRLAIQIAGRSR